MSEIINILKKFKAKGVVIGINKDGENLSIKGDIKALTAEDKKELVGNKQALISFFKEQQASKVQIPKIEQARHYQLSPNQKSLWIMSQFSGGNSAYNMPASRDLNGDFDVDQFKRAVEKTVARHEILRTVFKLEEEEVVQVVKPFEASQFEMKTIDFSNDSDADSKAELFIQEDGYLPFDLENGPLIRMYLLKIKEDKRVFYYNMHHIISDGWSMNVLMNDVLEQYQSLIENRDSNLEDLRIQYKDYAAWQLSNLSDEKLEKHRGHWSQKLTDELPLIDLPQKAKRPAVKTYNGKSCNTYIPAALTERIKLFAMTNDFSVYNVLLTSWKILMSSYTGLEDIIIGTPASGRDHYELNNQIGFYVNTLAIRSDIDKTQSFIKLNEVVKEQVLEAQRHQQYPFDQLIQDLQIKRDKSRSAVFDIILAYANAENTQDLFEVETVLEGLINQGEDLPAKFDLDVSFQEGNTQIYFSITYNSDLYAFEMLEKLMLHFMNYLEALITNTEKPVGALSYLSTEEKKVLVEDFNSTYSNYDKKGGIIGAFQNQVQTAPEAIALRFKEKVFSFQELDTISNQLANWLKADAKVNGGDFVGLKLEKNDWSIIAILAVLKLKASYVPMDVNSPEERLLQIKKDANLQYIIDEAEIQKFNENKKTLNDFTPEPTRDVEDIAYVMYTSGSTGKPKGVQVKDKGVLRLVKSSDYCMFTKDKVLLSTGAFSFDATTFEFWGMLLNGGCLCLCSKEELLQNDKLKLVIDQNCVNTMWMTSGWFNQVAEQEIAVFENLESLIVGGDVLSVDKISKVRSAYPDLKLINGYGPTENTTFSLTHLSEKVDGPIPIGKPINNSTCYILDDYLRPSPIGVVGEIYLGGDGLSAGYINDPKRTEQSFVKHPFAQGEKLYKSGDLGRRMKDGTVEFLGRKDNQVKIRGYRIELGEVEAVIGALAYVKNTFVTTVEPQEITELVAYVGVNNSYSLRDLRADLKQFLPAHMIPTYFVELSDFPLNKNGKVDTKALPQPSLADQVLSATYEAPTNEIEQTITEIWQEILGVERVGIRDDFFELGGHSLKATRIISKIYEVYEVRIELGSLFSDPTVETIAKHVSTLLWLKEDHNEEEGQEQEEFII